MSHDIWTDIFRDHRRDFPEPERMKAENEINTVLANPPHVQRSHGPLPLGLNCSIVSMASPVSSSRQRVEIPRVGIVLRIEVYCFTAAQPRRAILRLNHCVHVRDLPQWGFGFNGPAIVIFNHAAAIKAVMQQRPVPRDSLVQSTYVSSEVVLLFPDDMPIRSGDRTAWLITFRHLDNPESPNCLTGTKDQILQNAP